MFKRIIAEVNEALHSSLKRYCVNAKISMKQFIIEAVMEKLKREAK